MKDGDGGAFVVASQKENYMESFQSESFVKTVARDIECHTFIIESESWFSVAINFHERNFSEKPQGECDRTFKAITLWRHSKEFASSQRA